MMLFLCDTKQKRTEENLYLYDDGSIAPLRSGDWVLYLGSYNIGLSIDKGTKRIINFEGYVGCFCQTKTIYVPSAEEGAIYIDAILENDGAYYSEGNALCYNCWHDPSNGWYQIGNVCESGRMIEIAQNTFINLENGCIKAICFKPLDASMIKHTKTR